MAHDPDVDDAYALNSPQAVKDLYAGWAQTYDSGFAQDTGYALPDIGADTFNQAGGHGPVLDIGAGTGLVAEKLRAAGISPVIGCDISDEMLQVARAKGVYQDAVYGDVLAGLPFPNGSMQGVVSAGTFTLGHVGPQALEEVVRVLHPGGLAVVSVNAKHWADAGFEAELGKLMYRITQVNYPTVPIYRAAGHAHAGDEAYILRFRVR